MRLRNVQGSRDVIAQSPFVIHNPEEVKENGKRFLEMSIQSE